MEEENKIQPEGEQINSGFHLNLPEKDENDKNSQGKNSQRSSQAPQSARNIVPDQQFDFKE